MLIDFTVNNYASIKDYVTLSAEVGERLRKFNETNTIIKNHQRLLKNLLIFGANASGKSNIIGALKLMKHLVLHNPEKVTDNLSYNPFLLSTSSNTKDTTFTINFNYDKYSYQYKFSYNRTEITYESLSIRQGNKLITYFERKSQKFIKVPHSLKKVSQQTNANSLFIYTSQQNNDLHATNVIKWFQNDLIFVEDSSSIPDDLIKLVLDDNIKKELLEFLKFTDLNIIDIKAQNVGNLFNVLNNDLKKIQSVKEFLKNYQAPEWALYASHKVYDDNDNVINSIDLPIESESLGTRKVLLIALSIINAQINNNYKTLIFDEFDDSLHYELSRSLIKLFNSKANLNQFILTTHELQLMDSPIRQDQIYLVQKDFQGISTLNSIFDFPEVTDKTSFRKKYMEGSFGAFPIINADKMLEILNQSNGEDK